MTRVDQTWSCPVTDHRSPPPEAEACLCRPYTSSPKGGTVIAEDVADLERHEQRLRAGRYRPRACRRCGDAMHVHGTRARLLLGDAATTTEVARFRCADRERCGAVVQVLPAFIARHLWRSWRTVEAAMLEADSSDPAPDIPERTRRRWGGRLASSAALLIMALATAIAESSGLLAHFIDVVGMGSRRQDVVTAYRRHAVPRPEPGGCLMGLASLVHRIAPGVRLM